MLKSILRSAIAVAGLLAFVVPSTAAAAAPLPAASQAVAGGAATLFGIETATNRVVSFGAAGTTPKPVGSFVQPGKVVADQLGHLFVLDYGNLKVWRIDLASGAQVQVAKGTTDPYDIAVDPRGNLYVADGGRVLRISLNGHRTVLGAVGSPYGLSLTVDAAGTGTATSYSPDNQTVVNSYPLSNKNSTRIINGNSEDQPFAPVQAPDGTLYVQFGSVDEYGVSYLRRFAPGATTGTEMSTRRAHYAYAVDPQSRFYLLQSRTFCTYDQESTGGCVPDESVTAVLRYPAAGGTPTSIPVQGLVIPDGGLVVDGGGNLYASQMRAASPAVVRVAATGGAVTVLAPGQYTSLVLAC